MSDYLEFTRFHSSTSSSSEREREEEEIDMATEQSIMAVIRAARPQFRTSFDKAAFAVHAAFVAAGYVLHATGPSAFADDALTISSKGDLLELYC